MPVASEDKITAILETVAQMSVAEAKELKEKFKEKFGVEFPQFGLPAQSVESSEPVEEQTAFQVMLLDAGSKKIEVLKTIRELFGYSLQDAKAAVESLPHQFDKGPFDKIKAEQIREKLIAAGASVQLK